MKPQHLTGGTRLCPRRAASLMAMLVVVGAASNPAAACVTVSGTLTISGVTVTTNCVDVTAGGRINLGAGGTLVLNGTSGSTSTIDGLIVLLSGSAALEIKDNDHTFTGLGAIVGEHNDAQFRQAAGQTRQATLDTSLTVRGALKFKLSLVNNGLVWADDGTTSGSRDTLELFSGTFSGSGEWRLQRSIDTTNTDVILKIRAGVTAIAPTGPVTVCANSIVDVDEDFVTTGDLTFGGGRFEVAPGKTFRAG